MIRGWDSHDEQRQRFKAEAEAVARLQHPNVVQIHEVGEHHGCPYVALEYIAGMSLASRLAGTPQAPGTRPNWCRHWLAPCMPPTKAASSTAT
jgi:serine/threonine protein kinase